MLGFGGKKRRDVRQPRTAEQGSSDTASFRRSRTLTGSTSADIKAAGETRGALKSDRLKRRELEQKRQFVVILLLIALCAAAGVYFLIGQYTFNVKGVSFIQQNLLVTQPETKQYEKVILTYLQTHPGERFRFALNESRLAGAIQEALPEVSSINAMENGEFTVELRKPVAAWKSGTSESFVDASGEAFTKNYYTAPTVTVMDNSGATLGVGGVVASKGFLRFLGRIVTLVNASGVGEVAEATLPPNTTREIDIKLKDKPYAIKLHTGRDPAQEVEDLKRVVGYLTPKNIIPTYIDLRVTGRAYYK